ncbi:uncharacterized protein EKO05_0002773 [Ascochyta rabiei]|uniref:uncharacterized protein n=1 Tax=Didymella rabiei TaxID=5454 RepID=UPI002209BC6C|nr:uncharacterized protein EKO05_0002773 [Ascochyta rabiei]UPX12211.1 hypothetical protein EKO05_0002773 [Ascochyta rabiei]
MEVHQHLPLELVLNIITCSLPASDAILSPFHDVTKLLLTFTLVCHETRRLANRYLRERCVYLSSSKRLSSYLLAIKNESELRNVSALFLSPFQETIDDLPLCSWVRELFNYTCSTLKRLVIDIPLRSLYPEDDHLAVRRVLREGFERLENLEELVSTRDELYLEVTDGVPHPVVWRSWKKLKRLALYNVDLTFYFWQDIARLPAIETLVLSRSDGNDESLDDWAEYFKSTQRPFKIIMLGSDRRRLIPDRLLSGRIKNRNEVVDIPMIRSIWLHHTIDFSIHECQSFVQEHAEKGTLWDLEQGTIPCNGRPYVDEPYLAQLGDHWLMVDERRRAWSHAPRTFSCRHGPANFGFFESYISGGFD